MSATAIARHLTQPSVADQGAEAPGDALVEPAVAEREPWRRGRAGTSIGSAVHAVLQHADMADPTGADLADLCRWQTSVEGLSGDVAELVEVKARAALSSDLVARAVASGQLHRELHVSAPAAVVLDRAATADGGEVDLIEGFVDLCFEDGDGLVVVDYKTDDVPSEAAVRAALERYAPQGAAYALLLEAVTGQTVTEVHFLFLRGSEAVDAVVPDLPAAKERVRSELAAGAFA